MPLLVHFHGTVGARKGFEQDERPEEEWTLQPMLDLAQQRGFIVARPRARPKRPSTFISSFDEPDYRSQAS